jgi:hypothetical protein
MTRLPALAVGLAAAFAVAADPGDFRVVVEGAQPENSENSAVHGFVLLRPSVSEARAAGVVGRAYSTSHQPGNTIWGMVTEAINFSDARGYAVGLEAAVVNMSHDNVGGLRGLDVVFKNRMDASYDDAVPVVGQNRFNEDSAAIFVSSQPRSRANEYSGWQAGVKFARSSLDRSSTVPYAAAIDVSEVEAKVPVYLIVWRCGRLKCGLAPTETGAVIVHDIEEAARAAR